jgi:hypothetical protein
MKRKGYRYLDDTQPDLPPSPQTPAEHEARLNMARRMGHRSTPRAVVIARKLRRPW